MTTFAMAAVGLVPLAGDAVRVGAKGARALGAVERGKASGPAGLDYVGGGRLGGQVYSAQKLTQLEGYLGRRGIALQVGDEFVPKGYAGGFDAINGRMILRNNPTEYEVWHELNHFIQFRKLGKTAYSAQSRVSKEQYVFDSLEGSPKRWLALTQEQRMHARNYIEDVGGIW